MARKGRPRKFFCGPYEWKEYLVDTTHPMLTVDGDRCDGTCHYDTLEIFLNKDLPPANLRMIRLHERMHAIWHSYLPEAIPTDHEETIVDAMSKGMHQILEQAAKKRKREV